MHKHSKLGEVADVILEMFSGVEAYSKVISDMDCWPEDEEGKKICPTCNQTLYWQKLSFKKRYSEAMRIMSLGEEDMTFKEVTAAANKVVPDGFKDTYFRYFTEARHWGFLAPTGEMVDRAERYRLTQAGMQFLAGDIPADSFLLKLKGKDLVKRDGDADPLYIQDVVEDNPDDLNDGALHFQNSKPAL